MKLALHISHLEQALRHAEASALAPAETRQRLRVSRARIETPIYLRLDAETGIELIPAGAGGPRARTRSLGRVCVTFIASEPLP